MALHLRLLQIEMYLPNVSSLTDLNRALGPLRRHCKEQDNIALAIEPFDTTDRGQFSLVVAGTDKRNVEQESEHLLTWVETKINGQGLQTNATWL